MSKTAKWILAIVVIIIVVAGIWYYNQGPKVSPSTQETGPIKIGALFPLTGGLATYGEPAKKVADIAVEEINSQGGVNGRKVEINYQDHQCKPPVAVSLFQQLANVSGIKLFTSVACSGTVLSIAPQLGNDHLLLGTVITAANISGVSPFVFRNYASDATGAQLFANYISKNGYKKVAVIYEETDYAKGLKLLLEKDLVGSGVTMVSDSYLPDATDMRSQLTKLKASQPEVFFLSPQTVTSADKVLKQMKELSFRPKTMIVNENVYRSTDLNKNYPDFLNGAISVDYIASSGAKAQHVFDAYKAKYGVDCPQKNVCLGVYDNIYLLAQAAGSVGDDASKVRDYLKNVKYDGANGSISFNASNDRDNASFSLVRIKDGKGIEVK